tara:strand:+ start:176 stop:469 length:294 start_codon:yes stop_codon:yes gene_type:complete
MFEKYRTRNKDGTFKKDIDYTFWNEAWGYRLKGVNVSEELKSMLEKTIWTFIEAFIGALTVAPLIGVDASALQLAAMSGAGAALVVVKEFAKKRIAS